MSVTKVYITLFVLISIISCDKTVQNKNCTCSTKIDSIKQIPKYKFVNEISKPFDSIDFVMLKNLELKNYYLEDLRLKIFENKNNKIVEEKFLENYTGQYYTQKSQNQELKRFTIKKDSIEIYTTNEASSYEYFIYHSYNENSKNYYKVKAGQFFLTVTPSGIVFVKDNLCMDCPEMVFTKK